MAKKSSAPRTDIKSIGKAIDRVIGQLRRSRSLRPPVELNLRIALLKAAKTGIRAQCSRWVIFHGPIKPAERLGRPQK